VTHEYMQSIVKPDPVEGELDWFSYANQKMQPDSDVRGLPADNAGSFTAGTLQKCMLKVIPEVSVAEDHTSTQGANSEEDVIVIGSLFGTTHSMLLTAYNLAGELTWYLPWGPSSCKDPGTSYQPDDIGTGAPMLSRPTD
ncbi:hypothetical protein KIPB_014943, partial [Kipferlia bialata]